MKKRALLAFLTASVMLLMTACSLPTITRVDNTTSPEPTAVNSADNGTDPTVAPTVEPTEEPSAEPTTEPTEGPAVVPSEKEEYCKALYSYNYTDIFFVDKDNKIVGQIDYTDYGITYCGFETGFNKKLYYREYDYNSERYRVMEFDGETGEVTQFCTVKGLNNIEAYKGNLYLRYFDVDMNKYRELVYDISTHEKVGDRDAYYEALNADQVYMYNNFYSSDRAMDEAGYMILVDSDNAFYVYDGETYTYDGDLADVNTIYGYNRDFVVFTDELDETPDGAECGLYIGSRESGFRTLLSDDYEGYLGMDEYRVFWYEVSNTEQYNREMYSIYEYNYMNGEKSLVYSAYKTPATINIKASVTGFTLWNGSIYSMDTPAISNDVYWRRLYKDFESGFYYTEDLDACVQKFVMGDMGYLEVVSKTSYCENCGEPILGYYFEIPRFYEEFAENLGDTTGALKAISGYYDIINSVEYEAILAEVQLYSSDCEYHGSYLGKNTFDYTIDDIVFVGDKYMAIESGGYYYTGGVHGMPLFGSALFDKTTGALVEFADLYEGSEDDFRKLLAKATKRDFESYEDDTNPYFAESGDDVYDEIMDGEFIIDYSMIKYYDTYVEYLHAPYVLGPYASGYIAVKMTYEELGIKDKLGIK